MPSIMRPATPPRKKRTAPRCATSHRACPRLPSSRRSRLKSGYRVERLDRRASAKQISVAVNAVDSSDGGPELELAGPRRGIGRLFARIGMVPFVGDNLLRGVRRIFQHVVFLLGLAGDNRVDLRVD